MLTFKKKYFLIIKSIKDVDLSNIKKHNKFNIIYRNNNKLENIDKLRKFRTCCKSKNIGFYISNNIKQAILLKADGLYISANNIDLRFIKVKNFNLKIIGSAHNIRELNIKNTQGCTNILFSSLFKTSYHFKLGYLGVVKFNLFKILVRKKLVPLGGIRIANLNSLKIVNCNSIALLSEIKNQPNVIKRFF